MKSTLVKTPVTPDLEKTPLLVRHKRFSDFSRTNKKYLAQ